LKYFLLKKQPFSMLKKPFKTLQFNNHPANLLANGTFPVTDFGALLLADHNYTSFGCKRF